MEKKYVVGVDVGGQSSKIGVVDAAGGILAQDVLRYDGNETAETFVGKLAKAIEAVIDQAGVKGQVKGVGVGAPNGNYYTGEIVFAPNLPWAKERAVPFRQMLQDALKGLPVALTNDANAAAFGEMTYGVAKGLKHFIMITLGTGVGSGIVIDGKILYGSDGFAGELGHTIAIPDGRLCGCGKKGCLEAYCSAIGAAKTAVEWLQNTDEPSLLRDIEHITGKDMYDAAVKGDKVAIDIYNYTADILGKSLANFVTFSAPQAIVLFGGFARAKEFLYKPTLDAMNENVLPLWRNKVQLLFSSLKESDAAILGASSLAWEL